MPSKVGTGGRGGVAGGAFSLSAAVESWLDTTVPCRAGVFALDEEERGSAGGAVGGGNSLTIYGYNVRRPRAYACRRRATSPLTSSRRSSMYLSVCGHSSLQLSVRWSSEGGRWEGHVRVERAVVGGLLQKALR